MREVGYNALNLFTIVLAAFAGMLSIAGARRADGRGLGWGLTLLVIAVLPAVFGWVILLYCLRSFSSLPPPPASSRYERIRSTNKWGRPLFP